MSDLLNDSEDWELIRELMDSTEVRDQRLGKLLAKLLKWIDCQDERTRAENE